MDWIRPRGATEWLIDISVPLALAAATGFAAWAAGSPAWIAAVVLLAGAGLAALVLQLASGAPANEFGFALEPITTLDSAGGELLLDDRLELPGDSRVVRLFAPDTLALPGELAARIDDWLDGARSRAAARSGQAAAMGGHGPDASPASASLHAALAGIKQSLR